MVRMATMYTPSVMLSVPRRSTGVPNLSGSQVLYTTSAYSFDTHNKSAELRVLDVKTNESHMLVNNHPIASPNWLNDDEFACLQENDDGSTDLYWTSVSKTLAGSKYGDGFYSTAKIPASAGDLKIVPLNDDNDEFGVVLTIPAAPDGSMWTAEKDKKKTRSSGMLYKDLFVRHWDAWTPKQKKVLWFAKLSRSGDDGKYKLSELVNAMKGTKLESPILPFGTTDNFDLSPDGITFVAKDPDLDLALNTKTNVYFVPLDSWDQSDSPKLMQVKVPGFEGAKTSPVLSRTGTLAFLTMKINGYELDRNHIFLVPNVRAASSGEALEATELSIDYDAWDRSAGQIHWTADGEGLLALAEDVATSKVFKINLDQPYSNSRKIATITTSGYAKDVVPLNNGRLFVSGASLIDNSWFYILESPPNGSTYSTVWADSNSGDGSKWGLNANQISYIWTPASNPSINKEIHSIVIKPSNFDETKQYPVAYLIHGGPQASWGDNWSTRWNLAVYAEQGYIVVAPNPTGSLGYGQAFIDAVRQNWGGDPYQDIVNVFEWVGENLKYADNDRAVALGASYGGYMVNWIQGHDLGRKLKALVCHDGVFSMTSQLSSDELYFPFHDLGGTPWSPPTSPPVPETLGSTTFSAWRKYDPSEHLSNWATPQLVIHSSKDYRLPISEGLAAFNVLQARGVESRFLTFPDETHWVLQPENSLVWHKVVLNWVNSHVGLEAYSREDPEGDEFFGGVKEDEGGK
ncbi:alpha/beta-hydrolase [Teratosphaeria nubilosa]|uniref:Dipeptidyl-peptidase V n=1 Tax=Teratosphaeria nubilosa TaxID=161662 RepID=A0A6G1LGH5_9PEZI|nr:alpha/beta-hydrolase [Teratosphaeria nubilosa]